jgi:hypothetical protein
MAAFLRTSTLLSLMASAAWAQAPKAEPDAALPAPGARGNADNVPYIGKSDPSGNPVRLAKATGHVSNYSEDKVAPYTLPEALVMASGERVTTAQMWRDRRRPEILSFYKNEIYGRIPANAPQVKWETIETDANARDGAAIMKRLVGRMGDKPDGPRMNLTVYLPAKATQPVPMLLSLTFAFPPGGRGGKTTATDKTGGDQAKTQAKALPPRYDPIPELRSAAAGVMRRSATATFNPTRRTVGRAASSD